MKVKFAAYLSDFLRVELLLLLREGVNENIGFMLDRSETFGLLFLGVLNCGVDLALDGEELCDVALHIRYTLK